MPSPEANVASPPIVGLQKVAPKQYVQSIPDITPMRRGRPTAPIQQPHAAKPSPSPMRGTNSDPFAALDSQNVQVRSAAADELAARFPSLDEFSLLHERGQKFDFNQGATPPSDPKQEALNKRVTQALADEAFATPSAPINKVDVASAPKTSSATTPSGLSRSASVKKPQPPRDSSQQPTPTIHQPSPQRPSMVSTGIQTSPSPSPVPQIQKYHDRPIWRVPDNPHHTRALSTPRTFDKPQPSPSSLRPDFTLPSRPSLAEASRSKSQNSNLSIPKSPASSRPSLESQRPSALELGSAIDRSKSANARDRPSSIHVASNLEYLRDRERAPGRNFDAPSLSRGPPSAAIQDSDSEMDDKNISSNVDFLRAMEDDSGQKKHRRSSSQSKHTKRASLSSITSNTKSIVKGKFGDAFRKFESNSSNQEKERDLPLTPTEQSTDRAGKSLTPIAGSEATGGLSDDERAIDEEQELPPEVRRELERRRLSEEERRVEKAAAEYKQRLASQGDSGKGKAGPTRASTIQNRVKSLLVETQKPPVPQRTAAGYGHYTDTGKPLPNRPQDQNAMRSSPVIARKPIPSKNLPQVPPQPQQVPDLAYAKPRPISQSHFQPPTSSSAPPATGRTNTGPQGRPSAPPKPQALRTGGTGDFRQLQQTQSPTTINKALPPRGGPGAGDDDGDFDVDSFSKRYPSLSGLEMVETEIPTRGRVRDV